MAVWSEREVSLGGNKLIFATLQIAAITATTALRATHGRSCHRVQMRFTESHVSSTARRHRRLCEKSGKSSGSSDARSPCGGGRLGRSTFVGPRSITVSNPAIHIKTYAAWGNDNSSNRVVRTRNATAADAPIRATGADSGSREAIVLRPAATTETGTRMNTINPIAPVSIVRVRISESSVRYVLWS